MTKKKKVFELVAGPLDGKCLGNIDGIEYKVLAEINTKAGPKRINHIYQLRVHAVDEYSPSVALKDKTEKVYYDYVSWEYV